MSSPGCKVMCIVINFLVLWSICPSSSLVHFKNICPELPLMTFLLQSLVSWRFFVRLRYSGPYFFFHIRLFDGIRFQYYQVLVIFFLSKSSDSFLIWQFYSFSFCLFPFFIMSVTHFSIPNSIPISWLYILIVCVSLQFFFIFCKQLDVIHVHKVINRFLWLCKFVAPSAHPKYVIEWHHCYYK